MKLTLIADGSKAAGGPSTLIVHNEDVHENFLGAGTYGFSLTSTSSTPAAVPPLPAPDVFKIAPGDDVEQNVIHKGDGSGDIRAPGADVLESNGEDQYFINVTSGDALVFDITSICNLGLYPPDDAMPPSWTLRDPLGDVVIDRSFYPWCDQGPLVLPMGGTYVLTVKTPKRPQTYGFQIDRLPSESEAPTVTVAGTPKLTRIDPAVGAIGDTTTFSVYGVNLPAPTAVHLVPTGGGAELPTTLYGAAAVSSGVESIAASVSVNLRAAVPGNYVMRVDAGGQTYSLQQPFVVTAVAVPNVTVSVDAPAMYDGGPDEEFVTVQNVSNSDYYDLPLVIDVPNGQNATLVLPPAPKDAMIEAFAEEGADSALLDEIRATDLDTPVTAQQDPSSGHWMLTTYLDKVPSGGSVTIPVKVDPHASGSAPIHVNVLPGDHTDPSANDSGLHSIVASALNAAAERANQPQPALALIQQITSEIQKLDGRLQALLAIGGIATLVAAIKGLWETIKIVIKLIKWVAQTLIFIHTLVTDPASATITIGYLDIDGIVLLEMLSALFDLLLIAVVFLGPVALVWWLSQDNSGTCPTGDPDGISVCT